MCGRFKAAEDSAKLTARKRWSKRWFRVLARVTWRHYRSSVIVFGLLAAWLCVGVLFAAYWIKVSTQHV